jgi:hypothetical protein
MQPILAPEAALAIMQRLVRVGEKRTDRVGSYWPSKAT